MVHPKKLSELNKKYGVHTINADIGDNPLFFTWDAFTVLDITFLVRIEL